MICFPKRRVLNWIYLRISVPTVFSNTVCLYLRKLNFPLYYNFSIIFLLLDASTILCALVFAK